MQISLTIPDAYTQNPAQLAARAEDVFITELGALWGRFLLPAMRKATPYRTGKLRRSLVIIRDGNRLILAVKPQGFYWFMQPNLPLRYKAIYEKALPELVNVALLRTKQKIGL